MNDTPEYDELEQHEIGDTVTIDVWRGGDVLSLSVQLAGS